MTASLAYVFWHWKADPIGAESYEARARAFHASLAGRRPDGFLHSVCFSIPGAGWVPEGRPAYEDWYVIESSAVLDRLDHAAVSRLSAAAVEDDRQPRVSAPGARLRVRAESSRPPFAQRTPAADSPGHDARITSSIC